jgi:ABC-2 type transport system permease protein
MPVVRRRKEESGLSDSALARFERLRDEPLITTGSAYARFGGLSKSIRGVIAHHQLLGLLVRRDIKARYKDSVLGLLWTLINPIVQLLVYYLVMGQVLGAARGIDDFAIYIFAGLTIYGLLSEILGSGTGSVVANAGLVKKIYVQREVFPLAAVGSALFTFAVQLLVLIAACLIAGAPPITVGLVYFVPAVLLVVVYGTALALLLSALNVYLRDVQYLTSIVLMLAMWSSPIVYSWTMVKTVFARLHLPDWLLQVYTNNPLTLAVLGFHKAFWTVGPASDYPGQLGLRMGIALVVGLVLVWIGQGVFARLEGNFAQEL